MIELKCIKIIILYLLIFYILLKLNRCWFYFLHINLVLNNNIFFILKRSIFFSSFSLLLIKLWLCSCLSPSSLYQFMATTLPKILFLKNTGMLGNIIPKTLKQMTSNYH